METITAKQALEMIKESKGKIFSVTFVKKDGTVRDMVCRREVLCHLKGGTLGYNPEDFNLIGVFDMKVQDYRSINLSTLQKLKMNGVEYVVDGK